MSGGHPRASLLTDVFLKPVSPLPSGSFPEAQRHPSAGWSRISYWLASLPPSGREGTSHELGEALAEFAERRKLVAFVPTCPGRKVAELAGFLSENGFTRTHLRTKRTRTLRFTTGASVLPERR